MSQQPDDELPAAGPVMRRARFGVHVDRHRVANVRGELDVSTAPRFAVELDRLADDGGIVRVDFSDVEFCGAAGINVLFGAVRTLGSRGRLVICNPSPMVARLIDITGLDQVVDVAVDRVITAPHPSGTSDTDRDAAHRTVTAGAVASIEWGATSVASPDCGTRIHRGRVTTMCADDVHPGDVIDYHGEVHHISRVERRDGWAWPIACDDAGWAIALEHDLVMPHGYTESPSPAR